METGFTLDRESNTLALLCDGSSIVLAFDAREALIQWQVKIAASVPYVQQFAAELLVAPPRCRLRPGAARLHVQDLRVSLVVGIPPRLVASWPIADLRRYGPAEGKYVLEGGARCGRAEGLHVLGVSTGQGQQIHAAVEEAAQCRLQSRRKLLKKQDDSPAGASRRAMSRSCSRDGTLRSRDGDPCCGNSGMSPRDGTALCRQASLQWSTWSSDDCDLEYEPMDGSRANGDGQSEVSVSSSGSESAPRRLRPSISGQSLRSPRPGRRCSSECACAIKTTRSSLRRTGVLDEPSGQRQNCHSSASLPIRTTSPNRFIEHVYEEPGEKRPITASASPHRPITVSDTPPRPINSGDTSWRDPTSGVIRTVAEVHGSDPSAAYDRPRPTARRLSPEGLSMSPDHLYEDPGPADGWYQTPRACDQCRLMKRRDGEMFSDGNQKSGDTADGESLYKQPACTCINCGGSKAPPTASKAPPTAADEPIRIQPQSAARSGLVVSPGYETIGDAREQKAPVTSSGRPRVDGSGRMPVLNANTGEVEMPPQSADGTLLCPRIPSEVILGQGVYSKPERPAYAVIDKAKKTLIPGLPQPPVNQPLPEHQYANTTTPSGDHKNQYVNMVPAGGATPYSVHNNQYVNMQPASNAECNSQAGQGHSYSNVSTGNGALVDAERGCQSMHRPQSCGIEPGGERMNQYLNMSPRGAPPGSAQKAGQYANIASLGPRSLTLLSHQPNAVHASNASNNHALSPSYTLMAPGPPSMNQPTYVNSQPSSIDGSATAQLYANTPNVAPSREHPPVSTRPPSGTTGNYLEMARKERAISLRRSRSVDNGSRRSLRSLSLGRKPMPSPKPERIMHMRSEPAGSSVKGVTPPAVRCHATSLNNRFSTTSSDSGVTSSDSGLSTACDVITRLDLSGVSEPTSAQSPLSACSVSSNSPHGALASMKPRSGTEYQCVDRTRLIAQISEPAATLGSSINSSSAPAVDI